jgi:DNA polymerase elongation subunit (family B)
MRFYTSVKQLGNYLYVRGYEDGVSFRDKVEYYPTLYIRSNKPTEYKTLYGDYLQPVQPRSIRDTREFVNKYKDVDNFTIYGDISPVTQYISDNYPEETIDFDVNKMKIYIIDIETTSTYGFPNVEHVREEVLLITIQDFATKKTYTWGSRPFSGKVENNIYFECKDEQELLKSFIEFWENDYPDVITGFNCEFFDIPYLLRRIAVTLSEADAKRLSVWKYIRERKITLEKSSREEYIYDIAGTACLDFLALFKKFSGKNLENNRLDTVAQEILGESKLDHSQYETFADFYTKDFDTFTRYNIKDCELVSRLEEHLGLIGLAIAMAFDTRVNFEDVFYQSRMWDSIIYNYLKREKICIPQKQETMLKTEKFKGAYVKPTQVGKFNYIVTYDINSLYPSIIRTFNISPETLVTQRNSKVSVDAILSGEFQNDTEHSICANGSMYTKSFQGFLPKLMEKLYNERVVYKKLMLAAKAEYEKAPSEDLKKKITVYNNYQNVKKTVLNSAFGTLGCEYFRYYDLRNAEAITYTGQAIIRWLEKQLNAFLNKIAGTEDFDFAIAMDTDSIMINFEPIIQRIYGDKKVEMSQIINFMDKVCSTKVQDCIDKSFVEICNVLSAFDNKLQMKREKLCSSGLWVAKKNYIMNVWDNEGVRFAEPKIIISGISAIKSSTPAYCRTRIREGINLILNGNNEEIIDFIENCKKEFFSLPPEDVSFPKGVSNVDKYSAANNSFVKGAPIQSRASLIYNRHIKQNKLEMKYPLIKDGEKIKYCYLKMPNPINENVIGFIQRFPTELGLENFIDYNVQFEKTFITSLKAILDVIGWKTERVATLDFLFG